MKQPFTDYQAASILQRYLKHPVRKWWGDDRVRCLICRERILQGQPYLIHSSSARSRNEVIHSACFSEEWRQVGLKCLKASIADQQKYARRKRRLLDAHVAWLDRNRRDLRTLRRKVVTSKAGKAGAAARRGAKRAEASQPSH